MPGGKGVPMSIDPASSVPVYHQLKNLLREEIKSGRWKPGDCFPSEYELQTKFGISRSPVRQALADLVHEGYLVKRKGKRTSVATTRIVQKLPRLASFSEDMREKGLKPSYRLLRIFRAPVPSHIGSNVDLDAQSVPVVERLMLADEEPMALHVCFLVAKKCWDIEDELKRALKAGASLYSFLEHRGILLQYAEQIMGATVASKTQADLLNVKKGSPLLRMERLTFDLAGEPAEYVEGFYRADRYQYCVELKRNP